MQILAAEFGATDWNSDEEDGFDPYWGVVNEADFTEAYIKKNADFLARQLTPLLGRHAYKCGFLEKLASMAQVPLEGLTQPGGRTHKYRACVTLAARCTPYDMCMLRHCMRTVMGLYTEGCVLLCICSGTLHV